MTWEASAIRHTGAALSTARCGRFPESLMPCITASVVVLVAQRRRYSAMLPPATTFSCSITSPLAGMIPGIPPEVMNAR